MLVPQHLRQLDQGNVHLALDRRQNDLAIGFNTMRPLIAALLLGTGQASRTPFADPADRARSRHTKSRRRRPA
jgi:hypothetical protein